MASGVEKIAALSMLLALACCNGDSGGPRLSFCPQPDISAYELALIVRINLIAEEDGERIILKHPELKRHIVPRGECKEP
jgi:hypothetical protein